MEHTKLSSLGGKARAAKLSGKERRAIAAKGGAAGKGKKKPRRNPALKRVGNLIVGSVKGKEVVGVIGRGKNCTCSDCPVLYGAECPTSGNN